MPSLASLVDLDAALERFQEAAAVAQKWRIVGKEEKKLEKAMTKAFRAQGKLFLTGFAKLRPLFESVALREEWTDDDWIEVFDDAAADTHTAFLRPIQKGVQTAMLAGANETIGQVKAGISFSLRNPRAVAYIEAHGAELVSGIEDTTRDYIKTLMRTAADEGWSYNRTAQALTDRYSQFAVGQPQQHIESRAHLIAVQEVGAAYEEGNAIVAADLQDAGVELEKSALTAKDDRVSQLCADNEADGWIPYDESFSSGDDHAPFHVACRCTTLYRRAKG